MTKTAIRQPLGTSGREDSEMITRCYQGRRVSFVILSILLAFTSGILHGCSREKTRKSERQSAPDTRKAEQTKGLTGPVRYICEAIENNENQVQVFRLHRKLLDERPRKELIALVSDSWKALEEQPKSTDEPDTGPAPLLKPWASLNIHSRKPAEQERRWERETYIQVLVYDAPSAVTVTIAIYTGEHSGHYLLQGNAAEMTKKWVVSITDGG